MDHIDTEKLKNGNLFIIGNPYGNRNKSLTEQNLIEIVNAVKNGITQKNTLYNINTLTFMQLTIPKNVRSFKTFIEDLLKNQYLKCLDFYGDASNGTILTNKQIEILSNEIGKNQTIETLKIGSQDAKESSQKLAKMIAQNQTLRDLSCNNITDDLYDHSILRAALTKNNQLRTLTLDCTVCPSTYFRFPIDSNEIINDKLNICFEGQKKLFSGSLVKPIPKSSGLFSFPPHKKDDEDTENNITDDKFTIKKSKLE